MRSLWTGAIGFGLVNIPVHLYSGTSQESQLDLDMLHKGDLSSIRYAKVCKSEGEEVSYDEIVKGYEVADGEYIVLTDEDFERANVAKSKTLEVVSFTQASEINPNYFSKFYLLEPDKGGERAYTLLREALSKADKVGIVKFVLRNREHIGIVRAEGKMLVLNQMHYESEIQSGDSLKIPAGKKVEQKELAMALSLIEQLTEPFDPTQYHDTYQEELRRVIEEKAAGKKPTSKGEAPQPTKVKDLMSLLKASLEKRDKPSSKSAKSEKAVPHTRKSPSKKRA